jgi:hypothetical protein
LLLFNQSIYIFNIHTQDQYQLIKPTPYHKYTTIAFLDLKNEYLLANGTESGQLLLSPYNAIPEKSSKVLQFHKKAVTSLTVVRKECLVCCGEDLHISIWLLPFNVLKHEVKAGTGLGCVIDEVGVFKEFVYLRAAEGSILELNSKEGKLAKAIQEAQHWNCARIDSCTGDLLGTTKYNQLEKMVKSKEGWRVAGSFRIEVHKSEVKELGLLESEKAVVFLLNGTVLPWLYHG